MKVLGSIEWRAFFSGCREVVRLQVHTGWRMERFDKHQDIQSNSESLAAIQPKLYRFKVYLPHSTYQGDSRILGWDVGWWDSHHVWYGCPHIATD